MTEERPPCPHAITEETALVLMPQDDWLDEASAAQ